MTELRTLMDRAADQDFAAIDLDAVIGAGDRTVRRRQVVTGLAGLAALAAIVTGAVVLGDGGDDKADVVDHPFRTDVPMWTVGSVLHTPTETYDLGVDIFTFVRTSEGIVFTGVETEERLGIYSFTGEGEPARVGETEDPHLRSDPGGPFAGWLDQSGADPRAVVLDQGTGELAWSAPARIEHSFPIVAVDGASVYLAGADEHPTRVLDLTSGDVAELVEPGRGFADVEGDLTAYLLEGRGGADLGLEVRRSDGSAVEIRNDDGGYGVFSPGGRWISASAEDVSVYDTATGEPVDIGALDSREGFGYAWADADTLMVLTDADQAADALALKACEIPGGECMELTTFDDFGRFFAISDSDVLAGLVGDPAVSTSGGAAEMEATTETVTPPAE
jgi:hypothetical protein